MHKPMGKACLTLLILVGLFSLLGCDSDSQDKSLASQPSSSKSTQDLDDQRQAIQADDQAIAIDAKGTKASEAMGNSGKPKVGTNKAQDLIIKSNNQVSGSNKQVITELEKTTNELIKSLDSMENVNTTELDF